MKTQKTLTTILAALAVAASVLSAQTPDEARAALKALNVFKDSLSDWYRYHRYPDCARSDSQCLRNRLARIDRMARDAKEFLEKSPVLFSYNGIARDEELVSQRIVFAEMDKIAGLVISYKDAIINAGKSPTQEEKNKALIALKNLREAVLDFTKEK